MQKNLIGLDIYVSCIYRHSNFGYGNRRSNIDNRKKPGGTAGGDGTEQRPSRRRKALWRRTSTGVVAPPTLLDELTGLPNRRYLEASLHSNLEELRRYERPFGVLLFDIDNFKEVNELLGCSAGDKVLRKIGKLLNSRTRPFDVVGRAGGEAFLAMVANVDKDRLLTVAQKLCKAVEEMEIHTSSDALKVTVSVGGTLARPEDTREGLIKRVYRLMRKSSA